MKYIIDTLRVPHSLCQFEHKLIVTLIGHTSAIPTWKMMADLKETTQQISEYSQVLHYGFNMMIVSFFREADALQFYLQYNQIEL